MRFWVTLAVLAVWTAPVRAAPGDVGASVAPAPATESAGPATNPAPVEVPAAPPSAVVSPAPVAASPAACVPECRAGFECVAGACVSSCNPPCADGAVCTAARQCVYDALPALKKAMADSREQARAERAHNHEGGYLRLGLNFGYVLDAASRGGIETKSHGLGIMMDYALGLTFGHVVLGGEAAFLIVPSAHTTVDGTSLSAHHSATYSVGGLLVDVYPDPRKGLHFSGTLGFGYADVNPRDRESTNSGLGMLVGGGYDFWIGDEWSLGATARLLYIGGADDDFGSHKVLAPMLTLSALLH